MLKPTVICLTPVKNEAWILDKFIQCASLWADHIIIADQGSVDGSIEIARKYPKVKLIQNHSSTFNEPERQKLLIEAARRIPGPRLLIALDADEFLTANFLSSPEWNTIQLAHPGTVFRFQWKIINEDISSYWCFPHELIFGFLDDGSEHQGKKIHSPRLPVPSDATEINLRQIKVMHYWGVDPIKCKSKIRWYQCWEWLNQPKWKPIDIYRHYHQDLFIPECYIKRIPKNWLKYYEQQGIRMDEIHKEGGQRWDRQVLEMFKEYGTKRFKHLAIWDINWKKKQQEIFPDQPQIDCKDPRKWFEKLAHKWLKHSQPYFSPRFKKKVPKNLKIYFKITNKLLRLLGW